MPNSFALGRPCEGVSRLTDRDKRHPRSRPYGGLEAKPLEGVLQGTVEYEVLEDWVYSRRKSRVWYINWRTSLAIRKGSSAFEMWYNYRTAFGILREAWRTPRSPSTSLVQMSACCSKRPEAPSRAGRTTGAADGSWLADVPSSAPPRSASNFWVRWRLTTVLARTMDRGRPGSKPGTPRCILPLRRCLGSARGPPIEHLGVNALPP